MRKHSLLAFVLVTMAIAAVFSIAPARDAKADSAPQVVSVTPLCGATEIGPWDGVISVMFGQPVQPEAGSDPGLDIVLFRRDMDTLTHSYADTEVWRCHPGDSAVTVSSDGYLVTIDAGSYVSDKIDGDINNQYGNDYKYQYWLRLPEGAFVSKANNSINAGGLADYSYYVFVQTLPPQAVSQYPANNAVGVSAKAGTKFCVTFDVGVLYEGLAPVVYKYDPAKASWPDVLNNPSPGDAYTCTDMQVSGDGKTITFELPSDLEMNQQYGIMIPGSSSSGGEAKAFTANKDTGAVFPGIACPPGYTQLPWDGCWSFTTAANFNAPALDSTTPDTGAADFGPNAEIDLKFSQPVKPATDANYYVDICDYDTGLAVKHILNTGLLAESDSQSIVKITSPGLDYGKKYYINISGGAFYGASTGLPYKGLSGKSVYFTTIPRYTLTYTAGGGGSIAGASPQYVVKGQDGSEVKAAPGDHYHFVMWSDNKTDPARTDTGVTGSLNLTAQFAIDTFTLDYQAQTGGSVSGTVSQTVGYGGSGTGVTAAAQTGYHFTQWSDGKTDAARTDADITGNLQITAQFEKDIYEAQYIPGDNGKISGSSTQHIPYMAAGSGVTAVPDNHYHFVKWSDGKIDQTRMDTNVAGNLSVTAEFSVNTFTLKYAAESTGSITGSALQTVDYGGSGTAVTAVPNTGYHFLKWSDGNTAAARTDSNITADLDVTAEFAPNAYTLKYTAGDHGSLIGNANQTVYYGGSGTAVKAAPEANYHFVKWSDGSAAASRTDKNVSGNISVTASFDINTYKVVFKDYNGTILKSQDVAYGGDATPPKDPKRDGFDFLGWDGDYQSVTEAVTVTAQYQANSYKVTFLGADGTVLKTQYVASGGSALAPDAPDREGYIFTGWDNSFTNITADLSVTAQYTAEIYNVTFADYDGKVINAQQVGYGKDASAPANPERKGYTFTAWDKSFTNVKSDLTVTAQYSLDISLTKAGMQDGKIAFIIDTGSLKVTGASVEGGKASVNPDGTVTVIFPDGVQAGDIKVTFTLPDGTTAQGTVNLTENEIEQASAFTDSGLPWWMWVVIAVVGGGIIGAVTYMLVRRKRGTEV